MSQENAGAVRQPLSLRGRSRRTFEERLALRFPWLNRALLGLLARLEPSSRLRQSVLSRAVGGGLEAFNRRDWDLLVLGLDPHCDVRPPHEFVEAGLMAACYQGPSGYREFVSGWSEVIGDVSLRPIELIDLGDRVLVLADVPGQGQASGVPFTQKWAVVSTWKNGRIVRHQQYLDHAEALQAVGLAS